MLATTTALFPVCSILLASYLEYSVANESKFTPKESVFNPVLKNEILLMHQFSETDSTTQMILTVSSNGSVHRVDPSNMAIEHLYNLPYMLTHACVSGTGLVTLDTDQVVRVYDDATSSVCCASAAIPTGTRNPPVISVHGDRLVYGAKHQPPVVVSLTELRKLGMATPAASIKPAVSFRHKLPHDARLNMADDILQTAIVATEDGLVTGCLDGRVFFYPTSAPHPAWQTHTSAPIKAITVGAGICLAGSAQGRVSVINMAATTPKVECCLGDVQGSIRAMMVDRDGDEVRTTCGGLGRRLYSHMVDTTDGRWRAELTASVYHKLQITALLLTTVEDQEADLGFDDVEDAGKRKAGDRDGAQKQEGQARRVIDLGDIDLV